MDDECLECGDALDAEMAVTAAIDRLVALVGARRAERVAFLAWQTARAEYGD